MLKSSSRKLHFWSTTAKTKPWISSTRFAMFFNLSSFLARTWLYQYVTCLGQKTRTDQVWCKHCCWQVCYARILDSKRKFLEAALRYYELSQLEKREISGRRVDEDELQQALSAAVTCTILAAAGPQRSRVLATLYKVSGYLTRTLFSCL